MPEKPFACGELPPPADPIQVFHSYSGVLQMRFVNVLIRASYIDRGATETARPSTGQLCRQWQATFMHGVFPGGPCALAAMLDEVCFGALREVFFPRSFEVGSRLIEACSIATARQAAA
jgi:hypothetical protein